MNRRGLFLHMAPNTPMAAMITAAPPAMMRTAEPPIIWLPVRNENELPLAMAHAPMANVIIPKT